MDDEGTEDIADDEENALNVGVSPIVVTQRPWPAGLPDQIKAVAEEFIVAQQSLDLQSLLARFKGRGRWREPVPTLLDTLVALGRVRPSADGRWIDASVSSLS